MNGGNINAQQWMAKLHDRNCVAESHGLQVSCDFRPFFLVSSGL